VLDRYEELARDLETVHYWNCRIHDRLPLLYNNILSTGYFQTPSARMGCDGVVSMGASRVHPYLNLLLGVQIFPFVEAGITYRFFEGLNDPVLSPQGYGVRSDKGANLKVQLWNPIAHGLFFPDVAIGVIDFVGTDDFFSAYGVLTQQFLRWNLEASLGWSYGRLRGFFGALAWSPLRHCQNSWIKGLTVAAEYDPIAYSDPRREPHPHGRSQKVKVNYGLKYQVCDYWDLSIAHVRGEEVSAALSLHMDLADTDGWFQKVLDPAFYGAPKIHEPIGPYRPEQAMVQDLVHAFACQGMHIQRAWTCTDAMGLEHLWIDLTNECWRHERCLRQRIQNLLAALLPTNIYDVRVRITAMNLPTQQYTFRTYDLRRWSGHCLCDFEMETLSPMENPAPPSPCATSIFCDPEPTFLPSARPFAQFFFGSAKGKFKYAVGAEVMAAGEIPYGVTYAATLSYTALSTLHGIGSIDQISPSQIINVRTDSILYFQENRLTFPSLFLQKNVYFGRCTYGRLALGYFEPAYAGIAGELLFSPATSPWAIGIQGGLFKKRNYAGLGFQKTVRKLDGWTPVYLNYSFLSQYFIDLYYNFERLCLTAQLSIGGYLAKDHGATIKLTRYYKSGLKLYGWFTWTNFDDRVHSDRYNDFGVGFVMPLDLFLPKSCRKEIGRAMSAWLRDIGATAYTGYPLYPALYKERE